MTALTAKQAKGQLLRLLRKAAQSHEPIEINVDGKRGVLLSEDDWRAIEETLFLLSIPGMRASIRRGLKTPPSKCAKHLPW